MKNFINKIFILILSIYICYNVVDDRFLDPAKYKSDNHLQFEDCKERTRYIHVNHEFAISPIFHNNFSLFINLNSLYYLEILEIFSYLTYHSFSLYPIPPPRSLS